MDVIQVSAEQRQSDLLERGQRALRNAAWEEARACFEEAVKLEETPLGWEGVGLAAWWLDDAAGTFEARERAYKLYREQGNCQAAARLATWLGWDYRSFRGEPAVSNGWLQRAHRLLEEGGGPCQEEGWLALREAEIALRSGSDPETARRLSNFASQLGKQLGMIDLEMVGLALEGFALVAEGEPIRGMKLLDEATAAAMAGELNGFLPTCWALCYLIDACSVSRDYPRAVEWVDRLQAFCTEWRDVSLFAMCRTRYASVLMWRGAWDDADTELVAASKEFGASRPLLTAEGTVRLADLRRRQGRLDEAKGLFALVENHPLAHLGKAALARAEGNVEGAVELIDRFIRRLTPEYKTERVTALELLVVCQIELGKLAEARVSLEELQSLAGIIPTEPMQASVLFAEGIVVAGEGKPDEARSLLEDAVDLYERCGSPFEAARARVELGSVLVALGREEDARRELGEALARFETIGAVQEAERTRARLARIAAVPIPEKPGQQSSTNLTRRELDVLKLVAQGLSNQEIATRLMLSEHTVHRHVANMLSRLGVASRSAAVAYAARQGLL